MYPRKYALGACALGIWLMSSLSAVPARGADLDLRFEMEDSTLAVGEPFKCSLKLTNVSGRALRINEISDLGMEMDDFVIASKRPTGEMEYRRRHSSDALEITNPAYEGDQLRPRAFVHRNLYPCVTEEFHIEDETFKEGSSRLTFDIPGTYEVRLAYAPSKAFPRLWHGPGNLLFSNTVVVEVRAPTEEDKVILDAVWSGSMPGDDEYARGLSDNEALRRVIAAHPTATLIPHARFTLARSLAATLDSNQWEEARSILSDLRSELPDYRREETAVQLSYVCICLGDWNTALNTMREVVRQDPTLRQDYSVVQMFLLAKTHGFEAVTKWRDDRMEGKDVTPTEE